MTDDLRSLEFVVAEEKSELGFALDRYLKYALFDESKPEIKILLIEINRDLNSEEIWDPGKFYNYLKAKPKKEKQEINGILFFTLEEFPRGDSPTSAFNGSRMIREFFENSFDSVTANYVDLRCKLFQFISKILKNYRSGKSTKGNKETPGKIPFENALDDLDRLLTAIIIQDRKKIVEGNVEHYKIEKLKLLSGAYPFGGVHSTTEVHRLLREFYSEVNKPNAGESVDLTKKWGNIRKIEENYDLASVIASNPLQYKNTLENGKEKGFEILVIDDNLENIANDLMEIKLFFPENTTIYITEKREWEKFLHGDFFWKNMYAPKVDLSLIEINTKSEKPQEPKSEDAKKGNENRKFTFDFIVVDLLMGDYNEGNQIINNLVNFRDSFNMQCNKKEERIYFDIIVLSLSEEAHDISRSLNEGALCYVPKKRLYMLPAVVAKLEKSRQIIEGRSDQFKSIQKSRNFGKLYRLPEIIRRKLQTEPFLNLFFPGDFDEKRKRVAENLNSYLKEAAKEWIKYMPKADLHCHLGGSIDADTAFFLSLNMLAHPCIEKVPRYKDYQETLLDITETCFNFIHFIIGKKFSIKDLFQIVKILLVIIKKFDIEKPELGKTRKENIIKYLAENKESVTNDNNDNRIKGIYDILIEKLKSKSKKKKWFEALLEKIKDYLKYSDLKKKDPDKIIAEVEFFSILKYLIKEKYIIEKNQKTISIPEPVNIFNVLIGVIEKRKVNDIKKFWEKLEEPIRLSKFGGLKKFLFEKKTLELITKENKNLFTLMKSRLKSKIGANGAKNLLSYFISARQRRTRSLPEYLGGNEFMGSDQLQYKENILAALYGIIKRNIEDNVRYLEIRLSPDGYRDKGLTLQEAVQTLLSGTDLITFHFYQQGKFIRVNYIFSIKRHKSPREAALETSAAIVNREREKCYREIMPKVNQKNLDIQKYEWKPSKVMGIDLSGLEKENPAQNFVSDFYPLFKTSSFITIHAGEEDTAQSIWAAIYLLHANRIGHGLTLQENPDLKDMFKNMKICIEMNPISNTQTNPNIEDSYPFYNFFIEGLNITINTDNPAVSESTLSDEFVKAGELFQKHRENIHREYNWISRWEILRIVKNGFSNAFLDREEKRQLIRAVEEEIYQKIIKEYEC